MVVLQINLESDRLAVPFYALEEQPMRDDVYLINKARTVFREGYNGGSVEQVLSLFDQSVVECPWEN